MSGRGDLGVIRARDGLTLGACFAWWLEPAGFRAEWETIGLYTLRGGLYPGFFSGKALPSFRIWNMGLSCGWLWMFPANMPVPPIESLRIPYLATAKVPQEQLLLLPL